MAPRGPLGAFGHVRQPFQTSLTAGEFYGFFIGPGAVPNHDLTGLKFKVTDVPEPSTWAVMLVYSITFGGFVGMSSYVSLLLTTQYQMSKIDAGLAMAALSFTGAMVRPIGGFVADRLSGVRVLLMLLVVISLCNFGFAMLMPPLAGGIALLTALYLAFGLGNGATF